MKCYYKIQLPGGGFVRIPSSVDLLTPSDDLSEKIEDFYGVSLDDDCKWYDHITDMTKFSKKYPKFYFYFSNYGESPGDIWVSLFHNGKNYEASLEPLFPPLNELIGSLK